MKQFLTGVCAWLAVLAALAPEAFAHDEFRIIGTLTRVQQHQIDVKQKDGRTVAITVNAETLVTRDKKKVAASELKKGGSVVVDALGDDLTDLSALEVRIVPVIAPTKGK